MDPTTSDAAPPSPPALSWSNALILALIPLSGISATLYLPDRLFQIVLWREQIALAILGFALAGVYLRTALKPERGQAALIVNSVLAAVSLVVCLVLATNYETFAESGYRLASADGPLKLTLSLILLAVLLEAARRVAGWPIVVLVVAAIAYGLGADAMPGILRARAPAAEQLPVYLVLDQNGVLGAALGTVVTTVLPFIVLGVVLFRFGAGQLFLDLAMALVGRFSGAPAKVSLISSALFATVSGSAVANVATTGIVTIPMIRRAGFTPERAAAIEAVASTGGQILPPIMGAAAFIMADFLQVPYSTIAYAALLPALLYFVSVFAHIHFFAKRVGAGALKEEDRVPIIGSLRSHWPFLAPLIVLIYVMFFTSQRVEMAALIATATVFVAALLRRRDALTPRAIGGHLVAGGQAIIEIAVVTAVAGIIIGVLSVTGMAFSFGLNIVQASGGSLILLLVLSALGALVLGMGMPTTAVYILMATLIAPALIQAGVDRIGAHLFVFYFGVLSMITPPVCLASFAAASIAGSGYMRTGVESTRLGLIAFIVPFLFVLSPSLLLTSNTGWDASAAIVTAFAGCIVLAGASEGYLVRRLGVAGRLTAAIAGIALLLPADLSIFHGMQGLNYLVAAAAVALFCLVLFAEAKAGAAAQNRTAA